MKEQKIEISVRINNERKPYKFSISGVPNEKMLLTFWSSMIGNAAKVLNDRVLEKFKL